MFSTLKRRAAALVLSLATVSASVLLPPAPALAAALPLDLQGVPSAVTTLGEDTQQAAKTDLVVLFQKVEKNPVGYTWTYTVANGTPNAAQNVVVTKSFKIIQSGPPTSLATPTTVNIGFLEGYGVREIKVSCGNSTPQYQCVGTAISAKTSTPEVIATNNSASHSFK